MYLKSSEKIAVIRGNLKISYAELLTGIHHSSERMEKIVNQKVAIWASNSEFWIMAMLASWKNGATVIPIDAMSTSEEVAYILSDSKPEIIYTTQDKIDSLKNALPQSQSSTQILLLEEICYQGNAGTDLELGKNRKDIALIIYTSGTTGGPKGVMLSYQNLFFNVDAISKGVPIFTDKDKVFALLPFHHVLPIVGAVITPLCTNGALVIPESLALEDITSAIKDNKVTLLLGVPRFFTMLHKGIMQKLSKSLVGRILFALSKLVNHMSFSQIIFKSVLKQFGGAIKCCPCGGAALDKDVERDLRALGLDLITGYGMSEAAPLISFPHPGDFKPQTAGYPLKGLDIIFVDGEIRVKGENVMSGYYNRPQETADVFDENGFLKTGDLGYINNDGRLVVTGRKKEIIVLPNGKNINPDEIEKYLLKTYEVIEDVAVFFGENILQCLIFPNFKYVTQHNILNLADFLQQSVINNYNLKVAPYKKLIKLTIVSEELPKTRLGKLKRHELAAFAQSKKQERKKIAHPQFEEYRMLKDFLEASSNTPISPTDNIEIDLSFDSLDKVNLLSYIKSSFGIELTENLLLAHLQVDKLAEYIRDNKSSIEHSNISLADNIRAATAADLPLQDYKTIYSYYFSKFIFRPLFNIKIKGKENILNSPCIIAPNHQSFFDAAFLIQGLKHKDLKNTFFVGKSKHMNRPLVKALTKRANIIGVDLNQNLSEAIKKMASAIKQGKNLVIFPEGTRSISGELGEFKKLFAILAKELNVPILPVCIEGGEKLLPSGSVFPHFFSTLNLCFLPAIFPADKSVESIITETHQVIEKTLEQIRAKKT